MSRNHSALTKPKDNRVIERQQRRLTKQQKILQEAIDIQRDKTSNHVSLKSIKRIDAMTDTQNDAMESLSDGSIDGVMMVGSAGTGKTFLSLYAAINSVLNGTYDKVIIIRSIVSVRDIGFLPGTDAEKMAPYEAPYQQICTELFGRKDAYDKMKDMGMIEFVPSSFLRGVSLRNSYIVVDEAQSMNWHELSTVLTRFGDGSKIVICGDGKQNDLIKTKNDVSGFHDLLAVTSRMAEFRTHKFTRDDIVRSPFVKSWIIACESLGL